MLSWFLNIASTLTELAKMLPQGGLGLYLPMLTLASIKATKLKVLDLSGWANCIGPLLYSLVLMSQIKDLWIEGWNFPSAASLQHLSGLQSLVVSNSFLSRDNPWSLSGWGPTLALIPAGLMSSTVQ